MNDLRSFYRELGTTNLMVSPIGLGTVKLGRTRQVKYPQAFELPSDQAIKCLFDQCIDLGINLIDTAPAYGLSEERIGQLLPSNRHDWIIISKAGEIFSDGESRFDFSKQYLTQSVEASLKKLKTDYLDVLLIHSNGQDEAIIEHDEVFETLNCLQEKGMIRHYGMSCKTTSGAEKTLAQADIAMVTLNAVEREMLDVIEKAHHHRKGILIKKALVSGHLNHIHKAGGLRACFADILNQPGVHSIIVGTINPVHLMENVEHAIFALSQPPTTP